MQHRILLGGALIYLTVSNLIWIARDTRPPFWDMALHQTGALRIFHAFEELGAAALGAVPFLTSFYPPLYHSVVAMFYGMFGVSSEAARLANLPATAILVGSTYMIGRRLMNPMAGALAATVAAFYPLMAWLSRETLIDYWLTAMVALGFWALLETDEFRNRRSTVLFGVIAGLGMLTKWTFAAFLVPPALWAARRRMGEAALAAGIAAVVSAYWFVPRMGDLADFLQLNTAGGVSEGDPSRLSWPALVFYVRALEGYQLFLPLFLVFLGGVIWTVRNFRPEWTPLVLWLAGGWAMLLLFQNKDPRYSAPLLPAVALLSAGWIAQRRAWTWALVGFLVFQHYLVSFGIRALPDRVVIARGVEGPLPYHWQLYTQRYFDLWGRPERQDWKIEHVLDRISGPGGEGPVRLGMIPDIPRFDSQAFAYHALARRQDVEVRRFGGLAPEPILDNDYILVSEGAQGYPGLVPPNADHLRGYVLEHPEAFEIMEWFPLPTGEVIRLYRVRQPDRSSR